MLDIWQWKVDAFMISSEHHPSLLLCFLWINIMLRQPSSTLAHPVHREGNSLMRTSTRQVCMTFCVNSKSPVLVNVGNINSRSANKLHRMCKRPGSPRQPGLVPVNDHLWLRKCLISDDCLKFIYLLHP